MRKTSERSRLWRWALLVWVLAVGVRVVAISAVTGWSYRPESVGDAPDYHRLAVNLVEGRGYVLPWNGGGPNHGRLEPTAYRAPLWPGVLAATYEVAGERPWVGRLVNVGLDATTCALLVLLGAALVGPLTGALAGMFAAFYPPLWVNVFQLHSEVLFTLLLVLILLAAHRFARRRSLADAAVVGGLSGAAALARPNGLVVIVPLAVWAGYALRADGRRQVLRTAGVVVAGAAMVVMPWVVWTAEEVHVVAPITTQGAAVLPGYFSSRALDRAHTFYWGTWDIGKVIVLARASSSEADFYRRGQAAGLDFIHDHPGDAAKLVSFHFLRYFDLYWEQSGRVSSVWVPTDHLRVNELAVISWWAAVGLAVVGLWRSRMRLTPWAPALVVYSVLAVTMVLLGATTRLRSPTDIVVLLLAATAVAQLCGRASTPPTDTLQAQ